MSERKESSSAYTRPAGGATSGTSSGTRDYLRVYFGSDITTGTMYGTMSTYYNSVQDFAENLEDFPDFGGGEQLRYLAPMSPGPESPAPASFTAPPQNQAFTAPPAIQPPGPEEGGEEEPSTLGTVWNYAWEYGGEWVPLVGSGRGFKRAYDEGSTLGMAWNGFIFGVEATGVGAALGLIGKGGKAAVTTSKVAASGLRPMVSGMASAAKAKAVEAVSVAKSTVSDAVSAVGNKLDGLGERLAGLFWGGAKKVDDVQGTRATGTAMRLVGKYLESAHDVIANPNLLEGKSLEEVKSAIGHTPNWIHDVMRRSTTNPGGGWVFRETGPSGNLTGRNIQYHPGTSRHFRGKPYWKISGIPNSPPIRIPAL